MTAESPHRKQNLSSAEAAFCCFSGNSSADPPEIPLLPTRAEGNPPPRKTRTPLTWVNRHWLLPLLLVILALFLFPFLADEGLGFWGAGVCHRIIQRSFVISGQAMPLCARDTGMHLGFLTTAVVAFSRGRRRPAALPPPFILIILFLFLALFGVDGLNSYMTLFPGLPHLYEPHNTLRLLSGTLAGISLGSFFLPILHMTLWEEPPEVRIIPKPGELGLILLVGGLVDLLILWHPPGSFYPLSLLSLAGLFLALGTTNTLLVAVVVRRAGRVRGRKEALSLFLWGCLLATLEAASMAWLRHQLIGSFDFTLG